MSAILVPCLVQLRAELNALNPGRDRSSDGWIGDADHRARSSDHNPDETGTVPVRDADKVDEVHALDVDPDGLPMDLIVAGIVARARAGKENRLRYVIWKRTIWEASNGWRPRSYTLSDPHTGHAHFSASYDSIREADTRPWLKEIILLTDADKTWISGQIKAAADDLLTVEIGDKAHPGRTVGDVLRDTAKLRGFLVGDAKDTANAAIPAGAPIAAITAAARPATGS